jgi:hypothetical protein
MIEDHEKHEKLLGKLSDFETPKGKLFTNRVRK